MAQAKTIQVPITPGMRQDLSEHAAPVGTLTDALNVRFPTVGEVESRPGTNALSMANDATSSYVTLLSGGPGVIGRVPGGFYIGAEGFGFRYDFGKSRLFQSGSYSNAEPLGILETMAREDMVNGSVASPFPLSQATQNGYIAIVYSSGNGQGGNGPTDNVIVCKIFTSSGGIVSTIKLSNISAAWVVADGSNTTDFVLVTQNTTTGLEATVITTSASGVTIVGAVNVGTLTSSVSFWAACNWPGIGWALAYQTSIGTMTLKKLTGSTSLASQTFLVTGIAPVSVYADTTNLYVGWRESAGPSTAAARVYNTSLALTSGVGAVTLSGAPDTDYGPPLFGPSGTSATSAMYVITRAASPAIGSTDYIQVGVLTSVGVDVFPVKKFYQCAAGSAPFGNGYVWVRAGGTNANTSHSFHRDLMLDFMSIRAGSTVLVMDPVIALSGVELFIGAGSASYGAGWYRQHLGVPSRADNGNWIIGIPRIVREEDTQAVAGTGLALAEWLIFSTGGRRQAIRLGDVLAVAGFPTLTRGLVGSKYFDAGLEIASQRSGSDLGFPLPPAVSGSMSASTGALTFLSTYQFRVVVERIESDGARWRSAPSEIVTLGTSATTNTLSVSAAMATQLLRPDDSGGTYYNGNKFVLHVYRTLANGSTFYRSTPPQGAPAPTIAGLFTYTDGLSDASLSVREILYTDGGVLGNDCPPSARFIRATEDRVWLGGLWKTERLQSSKILVPGEPPQFSDSPAFEAVLPEPCTGLAVQDGNLIAFTQSAIYVVQGFGPNDQGQGEWGTPRSITRSSGCVSHLSILETSIGIFYQSAEGIEILPRGLGEPQFIGMPVQDLLYSTALGTTATVVSAAVVTTFRGRTARFVINDGASTNNIIVYDLDMQCWSRDKYGSYIMGIVDTDQGAVLGMQSMSGNFGALQESTALDQDSVGNSPAEIASTLTWADLRPYGVAGQGRFTGATGLFDAREAPSSGFRAGNATIKLSIDSRTESGKTFLMTTLTETQAYQRNVPAVDVGSSAGLTLTTAVGGWRFMGWTVEGDDSGGSRRMAETEQG